MRVTRAARTWFASIGVVAIVLVMQRCGVGCRSSLDPPESLAAIVVTQADGMPSLAAWAIVDAGHSSMQPVSLECLLTVEEDGRLELVLVPTAGLPRRSLRAGDVYPAGWRYTESARDPAGIGVRLFSRRVDTAR